MAPIIQPLARGTRQPKGSAGGAKKRTAKQSSEHPSLCHGPAGTGTLFTPNIGSRPRPGEQSITLQCNGRLKSLEGQKANAELQVTVLKGGGEAVPSSCHGKAVRGGIEITQPKAGGCSLLFASLGRNCSQECELWLQAATTLLGFSASSAFPRFCEHKVLLQVWVLWVNTHLGFMPFQELSVREQP